MAIVRQKYSGSTQYQAVFDLLARAATEMRMVSYGEVFNAMGLRSGNHAGREAGRLLGEISESMVGGGRPLLTAVVVNQSTRLPGAGFFDLASALGRLRKGASEEEKRAFWEEECEAVFDMSWPG